MDKKNLAAIKIFLVFMLLSSFSIFSAMAENIPYSNDEIEELGYDHFKILGLIGIHKYNLSEQGSTLLSEGYVLFSNTYNTSITISLSTTNTLSIMDLDKNKNPRFHHTISEDTVFKPVPDISWIKLDETVFTIEPYSKYKAYYTVEMPKVDAWESIDENTSNGFLGYIIIKEKKDANSGMNIGIDYCYKVFTLFTGEYVSDVFFVDPIYFIAAIIVIAGIIVAYVLYTKLEWVDVKDGGES